MTTEASSTSQTTTQAQTPPLAPAVDTAKIAQDAAAAAKEAVSKEFAPKIAEAEKATQKLKAVAQALGEGKEPAVNPLLQKLVDAPEQTLFGVKELAKREVLAEIKQEQAARAETEAIVNPILKEYPQLTQGVKYATAEALAQKYMSEGQPKKQALEKALRETAKEYGLQSVTEAQQNSAVSHAGIPGTSGLSVGPQPKEMAAQSNDAFLQGLKAKAQAVRKKQAA